MEGFDKQRLRRYAHSRGDVCDRDTDAARNVDGAALRIVVGMVARGLREPQPEQGAATGTGFAAATRFGEVSRMLKGNEAPVMPAAKSSGHG